MELRVGAEGLIVVIALFTGIFQFRQALSTYQALVNAVRSGARYERTLNLLSNVKRFAPGMVSKSGVMAGLGETTDELLEVFRDLAERKVDILTVGQYLRPSKDHLPIARYYTPEEFAFLKREALTMGFKHVEAGPLVRSSYHAHEQAESTGLASLGAAGLQ